MANYDNASWGDVLFAMLRAEEREAREAEVEQAATSELAATLAMRPREQA